MKMTHEDFDTLATPTGRISFNAHALKNKHPDWRGGQCLFNACEELYPTFTHKHVRGQDADPFHASTENDSHITKFWEAVEDHLERENSE